MKLLNDATPHSLRVAVQLVATVAALLVVLSVLLWSVNRDVAPTLTALLRSGFGDQLGLTETLVRMTPLLLCALAVALPAKAGLYNIGAEGQLHIGATAAAGVALFGTYLPPFAVLPSMVICAMVLGALWGLIPGWLRGRWGVNEVLVGLMLNYVAILLVQHLVHGPWKDSGALGWPYTARFPAAGGPAVRTIRLHGLRGRRPTISLAGRTSLRQRSLP
jgi:simple sugar transport system permease protein